MIRRRWRVSTELKTGLEREARRRNISLSAVLDLAAQAWLMQGGPCTEGDEEQRRLQQAASESLGAFAGGDTQRSERVREVVQRRLKRRCGR